MSSIIIEDFDTEADYVICAEIADTLWNLFPGYKWAVYSQDHNIIIRHMPMIEYDVCIFINRKDLPYGSPERLKKMLLKLGGEFLERSKLFTGGVREGDIKMPVEGMPNKHVIPQSVLPYNMMTTTKEEN